MRYNSESDLRSFLRSLLKSRDKVAFLVGSGLTSPAVPGTAEFIERVRRLFEQDPVDQADLNERLIEATSVGQYQAAAGFTIARRGLGKLNEIVKESVLSAFISKGDDPRRFPVDVLLKLESSCQKWKLTEGVAALGAILASRCGVAWGPVLTTNFDPLVEVAVRKAGGRATSVLLPRDGDPAIVVPDADQVMVVHLHGHWAQESTLHTQDQLEQDRPQLAGWIADVLADHHLIILGYGAWDDAFSRALRVALQGGRTRQVLFSVYHGVSAIPDSLRNLLVKFEVSAHVAFYAGIDVHKLLPEWANMIKAPARAALAREKEGLMASPVSGWDVIDAEMLDGVRPTGSAEQVLEYFDGRLPSWADIASGAIPEREAVLRATEALEGHRAARRRATILLLKGESGEGKSTVLRQVAARLARGEGWIVLWRSPSGLWPVKAGSLPGVAPRSWLLVSDDGDKFASELNYYSEVLSAAGRTDVHFLVAARDVDWAYSSSRYNLSWESSPLDVQSVRGLSESDASRIVGAWGAYGERGLGELASLRTDSERIDSLLKAAKIEADTRYVHGVSERGAFLGAMLRVRFGRGLREHIRSLLVRISQRHIDAERTLLHGFYFIAAMHAERLYCLTPELLAAALGVSSRDVVGLVVMPLGQEALATPAGNLVLVRHRAIAEEAMALASELGIDVVRLFRDLVRAVVRLKADGFYVPNLADLEYVSTKRFSDRPSLAVPVSEEVYRSDPRDLSYATSYVCALRRADRYDQGYGEIQKIGESWERLDVFRRDNSWRGFFVEWSLFEQRRGAFARAVILGCASLADGPGAGEMKDRHMRIALSTIGEGLLRWDAFAKDEVLCSGLNAVRTLFEALVEVDDHANLRLVERMRAASDSLQLDAPKEYSLTALAEHVESKLEAPFPAFVERAARLRFRELCSFLEARGFSL